MIPFIPRNQLAGPARLLMGAVLLSSLSLIPATGRTMEIIPSVAMTKSTDTNADDAKFSGGLALRMPLMPFLKLEGGIAYRQESYFNNALELHTWPVTLSAWVTPIPMLYAGGGLGWYRTTYTLSSPLPHGSMTTEKLGEHLGGGVIVPLAPRLGLDVNGRYIFMQKNNDVQLPTKFNPDFWTASAGLAIRF